MDLLTTLGAGIELVEDLEPRRKARGACSQTSEPRNLGHDHRFPVSLYTLEHDCGEGGSDLAKKIEARLTSTSRPLELRLVVSIAK